MTQRTFVAAAVTLLVLLALLVGYLASVQWSWLDRMEVYEHVRTENSFSRLAWSMKAAFDQEIERLAAVFRLQAGRREEIEAQLRAATENWRKGSRWPDLLAHVWLVSGELGEGEIARYAATSGRLDQRPWPAELTLLRQQLAELASRSSLPAHPARLAVLPRVPAVVLETRQLRAPSGLEPAWLVLQLDSEVFRGRFLPELSAMFFAPPNFVDIELAVVESEDSRLVFSTLPISTFEEFGRSDVAYGLVDAGTDGSELVHLGMRPPRGLEAVPNSDRPPTAEDHVWFRWHWARISTSGYWQLHVRRGPVPVAEEVAANRRRALRLSFGALALLAVGVVLIVMLARRAQKVATQQLELLASVTHELRTPLAILAAAGENLEDDLCNQPSKLKEYGRLIQEETRRLKEMAENVLHLARSRAAAPAVSPRPLDLRPLVEDTVRRAGRQIEQAGFELEVELPEEPRWVLGNARGLEAALSNLISNALKYGLPGRWLKVSLAESKEARGELELSVADRGEGISKAEQLRVFEPFFRGRRQRHAQLEGSGLGLAVVRQVAAAHGGRVTVSSALGEGSCFTLHLPHEDAP